MHLFQRILPALLTTCFFPALLQGASNDTIRNTDSLMIDRDDYVLTAIDSLTNIAFEGSFLFKDTFVSQYNFDSAFIPTYPDSLVIENLRYIPAEIPLIYNRYVKSFINLYAYNRREQVSTMLGLSEYYFPLFEAELDKRGLPHELKYLPIVESALNPHAVSRAGATGLWQIMYGTGRLLGLNMHTYLDERRDPHHSTRAALDYLERMHDVYKDWLLVIAAYNCGPGNVNKAIRRSGGKRDFWEIRAYLPRETRGYVPAFIAATYVMHYHDMYNLKPTPLNPGFNATDTVMVNGQMSLKFVSELIGSPVEQLAFLNPGLKKQYIPPTKKGYALKLPIDKVALFEDKLKAYKDSIASLPEEAVAAEENPFGTPFDNLERISYRVRNGDNLGAIAGRYGVKVSDIREWNDIRGNLIRPGQRLDLYVTKRTTSKTSTAKITASTSKSTTSAKSSSSTSTSSSSSSTAKTSSTTSTTKSRSLSGDISMLVYTVKYGDNLGYIAEWYDCRAQDIREWNGIRGNSINVGQRLNIYVPTGEKSKYAGVNSMDFTQKQAIEDAQHNAIDMAEIDEASCSCKVYEVKPGDTIWDIAKKFPGVTVESIKRSNKISDTKGLKPGMRLIIQI